MKKIFFTLVSFLAFSSAAMSQVTTMDTCRAEFDWKVNDMIMMFAPGMAVNFYDQSAGGTESWFWDFGDGNFSEEQNPMHIFTFLNNGGSPDGSTGEFVPNVCLTIKTNAGCKSNVCKSIDTKRDSVIYPDSACYVYFYPYRNDSTVSIPEMIPYSFKVYAPDNTISWSWDFGDGTGSTEQYPSHSYYFMGGVYNICLKIATADGCTNSYCVPFYLGYGDSTVVPDCQAAYTWYVMESYPQQYAFEDLSAGNTTAWFWDFGDGSFSNEQNPVHIFNNPKDSLYAHGYLGPPIADGYKVCLTVVNDNNCKSTYCDYVYMGSVPDTIYPQPCPYFISVTTSNILGGNFCNGTASASLVDAAGNAVDAADYYWSTGETGPSASGLCVNSSYYVSITGVDGCQLVGSFAIIDYTKPMDPVGYWTIYGNGSWYDLNYAVPDTGYVCNWLFSDGTKLTGDNVNYNFDGSADKYVTLNVVDAAGNVVYTEEIALNQATAVKQPGVDKPEIYPNPATDEIHIRLNTALNGNVRLEIYNSLGQKLINQSYNDENGAFEISAPISELGHGIYYARILGIGDSPVTLSFVK